MRKWPRSLKADACQSLCQETMDLQSHYFLIKTIQPSRKTVEFKAYLPLEKAITLDAVKEIVLLKTINEQEPRAKRGT